MLILHTENRRKLTKQDLLFLEETLTKGESGGVQKALADPELFDEILECEAVYRRVIEDPRHMLVSPQFYFYVVVRHALQRAGLESREMADYISGVLASYSESKSLQSLGESGADFTYTIDFYAALENSGERERFGLHVYAGNRFLFLTGLFPEFLRKREERRGAPGLRYYEEFAQRAFRTACDHPQAKEFALTEVYDALSQQFTETRRTLNDMSERLLFLES